MKKILILYPHFPPSNLAGVHRPRLFAQHLKKFGWEPVILTVDERYYDCPLYTSHATDDLQDVEIDRVEAYQNEKFRFISDIGLRSFIQLNKRAKK